MVGQKNLLETLNKYNSDNFPNVSILLGDEGSGRHTMVEYISNNILHLNFLDITDSLSSQYIEELKINPVPYLFMINTDKLSENNQNSILKLLEEMNNGSKIVLIGTSELNILDTVLNRSVKFNMDPYSTEDLLSLTNSKFEKPELVALVCSTPGQISTINDELFTKTYKMGSQLTKRVRELNLTSLLALPSLVDKAYIGLFFKITSMLFLDNYKKDNTDKNYSLYLTTKKYCDIIISGKYNSKNLFNAYMVDLWEVANT